MKHLVAPRQLTRLDESARLLFEGAGASQYHVLAGAIDTRRTSVLRGKVFDASGAALAGVKVSALGKSSFGDTLTKPDGTFDLAVSGGDRYTLVYEKTGVLSSQRQVFPEWGDFAFASDVTMIPPSTSIAGVVDLSKTTAQIVAGDRITDSSGTRIARVLVMPGTKAKLVFSDKTERSLPTFRLRITEYTTGARGPSQMPGDLPPASAYTYASQFFVEEAETAGAVRTVFDPPLVTYLDNFLAMPAGTQVPAGSYNKLTGAWEAADNGRIVKVIAVANGTAQVDANGDGNPDTATELAAYGISDGERAEIGKWYGAGASFWRMRTPHFTDWDFNFGFSPPSNAVIPSLSLPRNESIDDGCMQPAASVIECQNQILGEDLAMPGTGLTLHYHSDRVIGGAAQNTLDVPVFGATLPPGVVRAEVVATVAGRVYMDSVAPALNAKRMYVWDGLDVYGRKTQGRQRATVRLGYVYNASYEQTNRFGDIPKGSTITASRTRKEVTMWTTWQGWAGYWDASALGLGGWSLDVHQVYDPQSGTLYKGNGERSGTSDRIESRWVLTTSSNRATTTFAHDPIRSVLPEPAGTVLLGEDVGRSRVLRMGLDGALSVVAGRGLGAGFRGDGGPATDADFNRIAGLARAVDGSILIADLGNARIRRISPTGIVSTIAGTGVAARSGDGGPATAAAIGAPSAIVATADGAIYFTDTQNHVVRRIGPDGVIATIAGTGVAGKPTENVLATASPLNTPTGLAVARDGRIFIADSLNHVVRRIGIDGRIATIAGSGTAGFLGDGGAATAALLNGPHDVAWSESGELTVSDELNRRVRQIDRNGLISTLVGSGESVAERNDVPPLSTSIAGPRRLAWAPDQTLYFVGYASNFELRRLIPNIPRYPTGDVKIPSRDGEEVYVFNNQGRHLRTLDGLTSAVALTFEYDASGALASIKDRAGNATTLTRDASGRVTSIVGPKGVGAALAYLPTGELRSVTDAAGATSQLTYSSGSLLSTLTDALGGVHRYTFDATGRLTLDTKPSGSSYALSRAAIQGGWSVTMATALGRTKTFTIVRDADGRETRTVTLPNGSQQVSSRPNGLTRKVRTPEGAVLDGILAPDPRFGMLAPYVASLKVTFGGKTATITRSRATTVSAPSDPLSVKTFTETTTVNGRASTTTYDAAAFTTTSTSAGGRTSKAALDALGRVVRIESPGVAPTIVAYGADGNVASLSASITPPVAASRTSTFTYGSRGYLQTATNAFGQATSFESDLLGQVTKATLPTGDSLQFGYDALGELTSLTPPGRTAHAFAYSLGNAASYTPPALAGTANVATKVAYNRDDAVDVITRRDGAIVANSYDVAGRLTLLTHANGSTSFPYDPTSKLLLGVEASTGEKLAYTYTSGLRTSTKTTGSAPGTVSNDFDTDFRPTSELIAGFGSIAYAYEADSLLKQVGSESLTRAPGTRQLATTVLGKVNDAWTYTTFGDAASYTANVDAGAIFKRVYDVDALGRITSATETMGGTTTAFTYVYDARGRLTSVAAGGVVKERYEYDANGNRVATTLGAVRDVATYDAQDRLASFRGAIYAYGANGELASKTAGTQKTTYTYDALGALKSVARPALPLIEYVTDGFGRRTAKKVGGTIAQRWLYGSALTPIAEVSATGAVVARYVYGTRRYVPDFMVKGGVTYRVITDQVGSVRLVVNTSTGAIAQRIDYDAFGRITQNTSPGFQPFAFAGGLYDADTGLVRLGARDYDASIGRWTAKDPTGFRGGDANLYAYAYGDPVNYVDVTGLDAIAAHGGTLTYFDNAWQPLGRFSYTTGRPGVLDPSIVGEGPIPLGTYIADPAQISAGGFFRNLLGDWGAYRVPLRPAPGTNTFGRNGFFLHGGRRPGSAGCIDVGASDKDLFSLLRNASGLVPVIVY